MNSRIAELIISMKGFRTYFGSNLSESILLFFRDDHLPLIWLLHSHVVLRRALVVRLIWNHGLLLWSRVWFLVVPKVSETPQYRLTLL